MTWWVVLDDVVERPRYHGVMCWVMGVPFAMSLWGVLDESRRECRNRGVQFRLFAHRKTSRANTIGIRLEVRTERHFLAAQDNFRRRQERMVCNSAFLHTARPVTRRRLGIRQAFRRPEMPFSTAFSLCIAAERPFPTFAKSKSVFLKQTYRENNLS